MIMVIPASFWNLAFTFLIGFFFGLTGLCVLFGIVVLLAIAAESAAAKARIDRERR
ncbi:hypothetical protein [Novosphingobium guangzhouense]|uniref:hypothetical protein n=1 Tax=Novosphingobium guangzhouense TaxID=1850347 RepID=UPI0014760BBD|nr:hypothetical protein [Novosphingobium guangzhouense]